MQFGRYLQTKDDAKLLKRYREDIKLMFYNNRTLVENTKKIMEASIVMNTHK